MAFETDLIRTALVACVTECATLTARINTALLACVAVLVTAIALAMDAVVACDAVSVTRYCCAAALPPIAQVGVRKRFGTARAGDVPGQMTRENWVPMPWA